MKNTYVRIKLNSNLESHQIPSGDGQMKEKSNSYDPTALEDYTMLTISQNSSAYQKPSKCETQSAMPESAVITKKKTLKDKSPSLNQNIQMPSSSKILVLDSIGNDQVLSPFWTQYTKEMSTKLWFPTKTDCVDLDLKSWNGYSKNTMLNSWFSVKLISNKTCLENYQRTYLLSLQSLLPEITVLEQENTKEKEDKKQKETNEKKTKKYQGKGNKPKKEKKQPKKTKKEKLDDPNDKQGAGKSIKKRVYFNQEQKATLRKWFGVIRWIYNRCLSEYNSNKKITVGEMRKKVINNDNYKDKNTWMLDYHYDLRDEAMRDLFNNINSNNAKGKSFTIKYKSLKQQIKYGCSMSVLSKHWNKPRNFYRDIFSPKKMRSNEKIPDKLDYTCRLLKSGTKKYYLCMPQPLKVCENQARSDNTSMIFLDPGSRNFVTGYDPSGKIVIWGQDDVSRIGRLLHHKRKLISKRQNKDVRAKQRRNYTLALTRLGEKIRNLVTDLHRKLSKWLCENYSRIYLPRLNFHNMKKLNKRSKQHLASWRHCEFLELLKNKTREYNNCYFYEVNEAYTSITCSCCGYQKKDLGRNRTYQCDMCGEILGRDINASKNIMLRYFSKRAIITC